VRSLQVNRHAGQRDSIKNAPKSSRSLSGGRNSRPARALIGQPSGLCPRLAPPAPAHTPGSRTACHVCILQPRLMQCARQMLHSPTIHHSRQQRSIGHSLLCKVRLQSPSLRPEVSCKRARPDRPDGQVKSRLHASLSLRRDKYSKVR
jgi:hypothetical protein